MVGAEIVGTPSKFSSRSARLDDAFCSFAFVFDGLVLHRNAQTALR